MNSITAEGFAILKKAEGLNKSAYWDVNGWAIGYGMHYYSNGTAVQKDDLITSSFAETEFLKVLANTGKQVFKYVKVSLSDNQYTALVMYSYNRGIGSLANSKLLKMVNLNPNNSAIPKQFVIEWGTNTQYKEVLISRRNQEANLYAKGTGFDFQSFLQYVALFGLAYWLFQKIKTLKPKRTMRAVLFTFFLLSNFSLQAGVFVKFFHNTIHVEGQSYTNCKLDAGGETKFGITLSTFKLFCKVDAVRCDLNNDNVVNGKDLFLTRLDNIKPIYKKYYWDVIHGDQINNQAIAEFIADFVVNSGASKKKLKQLQKVIGIKPDGFWGMQTVKAINKQNPKLLFEKLYNFRVHFYQRICAKNHSQKYFYKGWINRISKLKKIYSHEKFI